MAANTRKKICINFDKSDMSSIQNCVVHSRYSAAGKLYERKKTLKVVSPPRAMRSAYPLRESIWEYLNEDSAGNFNSSSKRRTIIRCKQTSGKDDESNIIWLVLMLVLVGTLILTYSRLSGFIAQSKFITKVVPKTRLISLFHSEPSLEEECCYVMNTLSASLLRAERALRNTQRIRRLMIIRSQVSQIDDASQYEHDYIEDAMVTRGSNTVPWMSRIALWGVLPLWRASPPTSTVLAKRIPKPSDCWPFSGSRGEIVIQMKHLTEVRSIGIEHIRPDTAKSAPKNFVLFGILENGTRIKSIEAEYTNQGPAKQFFRVSTVNPLQKMILRIFTNQGNPKYTCVYRIHLYRKESK